MNHNVRQGVRGPLARFGRRVAAIVAECNYAQTQVASLRNTPALSDPGQLAPGAGPDSRSGSRARSRTNQPLAGQAQAWPASGARSGHSAM